MKFDTMLSGLAEAPAHARRLEQLGVDGAFTFEGPHDIFTPLILAAAATETLELATNVAIAFPRNPVQLAHQAYDLQLLSHGRFTPWPRLPDQSAGRETVRGLVRIAPSRECERWSAALAPFSPRGRPERRSTSMASSGRTRSCLPSSTPGPTPSVPPPSPWVGSVPKCSDWRLRSATRCW